MGDPDCHAAWVNWCQIQPRLKAESEAAIAEWDAKYGKAATAATGVKPPPRPTPVGGQPDPKGPNIGSWFKSVLPVVGYGIRGMM